ncbi:MAG: hypothetical protein WCD86_20285 [Ktedonobacteraceae bacterium]
MRHWKGQLIAFLALVALICGVAALMLSPGVSNATPTTRRIIIYPPGVPAIVPSHNVGTNTMIPAFTVSDVKSYISKNGFPGGPTVKGSSPTVLKVLFITAKQASILMRGEDTGRPDNALVCYVLLKGPFDTSSISVPSNAQQTPTAHKPVLLGEMLFDAHTGNLLVWGIPPQ